MKLVVRAAAIVLGSAVAATSADAGQAAGLALEVSGTSEPQIDAYSEIAAGSEIRLAPGTRLKFVHYGKCEVIVVTGGILKIGLFDVDVAGKVESRQPQECPKTIALTGGKQVGGILMRGVMPGHELSVRPSFILTGKRAGAFAAVRILEKDGGGVLEAPLAGRRLLWPRSRPPLTAGRRYVAVLRPQDAGSEPVRFDFTAVEPNALRDREPLVLIRVD